MLVVTDRVSDEEYIVSRATTQERLSAQDILQYALYSVNRHAIQKQIQGLYSETKVHVYGRDIPNILFYTKPKEVDNYSADEELTYHIQLSGKQDMGYILGRVKYLYIRLQDYQGSLGISRMEQTYEEYDDIDVGEPMYDTFIFLVIEGTCDAGFLWNESDVRVSHVMFSNTVDDDTKTRVLIQLTECRYICDPLPDTYLREYGSEYLLDNEYADVYGESEMPVILFNSDTKLGRVRFGGCITFRLSKHCRCLDLSDCTFDATGMSSFLAGITFIADDLLLGESRTPRPCIYILDVRVGQQITFGELESDTLIKVISMEGDEAVYDGEELQNSTLTID